MNRIANRLAIAGLLLAVACTDSKIQTLGSTYTLQGIIADAVTGARVGGDIKMFLIQGPEVRGPSRLITGTSDPLMGEYAFTGVPVEYVTGNNVWKVVAVKSGYQRFESEVTFTASTVTANVLDSAFSKIGNIYLFPTGVTAPDYTIITTYNGKPVPGATVQLDPISGSNGQTFINGGTGDTLTATNGYVASLALTTDATGKATFAGTLLALGAQYNMQVLPVAFKDPTTSTTTIQLALNPAPGSAGPPTIIVGLSNVLQPLALTALLSPSTGAPLYLVDASNRATGTIQSNGALIITFNTPVSLVNPNGFAAAFSAGTKADGTTPGTAQLNSVQPVNASLSADGLTLTLTPNYSGTPTGSAGTPAAPGATDRGVLIQYKNGGALVAPKDYPASTSQVLTPPGGALKFANGAGETGIVVISAP